MRHVLTKYTGCENGGVNGGGDNSLFPSIMQPVIQIISVVRGGAVGWDIALEAEKSSRVRFPMAWLEFFIYIILPAAVWLD